MRFEAGEVAALQRGGECSDPHDAQDSAPLGSSGSRAARGKGREEEGAVLLDRADVRVEARGGHRLLLPHLEHHPFHT